MLKLMMSIGYGVKVSEFYIWKCLVFFFIQVKSYDEGVQKQQQQQYAAQRQQQRAALQQHLTHSIQS